MFANDWLDRLQRKYGRYAIHNLMNIIVGGMGIVFVLDAFSRWNLSGLLHFSLAAIRMGQIWRLITFVFVPPNASMITLLFSLYFYWMIGSALEHQWGAFRFNMYYLCGIIGSILSGCITGYATNTYLNMSLFLGFALMFPDFEVNLFFFLPVKMKILALIDAIGLLISFFRVGISGKIALIMAIINVILFFGRDLKMQIQNAYRRYQWKKNFR